jgi:hypothetical protein
MKSLSDRTIEHDIRFRIKQQKLERDCSYQQYKNKELILNATLENANILEKIGYAIKRTLIRLTPATHYYNKSEH